jgi:hypothetical protein
LAYIVVQIGLVAGYKIPCHTNVLGFFLQDVHETAAGALWNLAFNSGNAQRIVEAGGIRALIHLCSSSSSKMARFMAALALAYIFDGRYKTDCMLDDLHTSTMGY